MKLLNFYISLKEFFRAFIRRAGREDQVGYNSECARLNLISHKVSNFIYFFVLNSLLETKSDLQVKNALGMKGSSKLDFY